MGISGQAQITKKFALNNIFQAVT